MKPKVLAVLAAWVICAGALIFALVQMQSYAQTINNAGVVRGGTQQSVKLALSGKPNDAIVARVDDLIDRLFLEEEKRPIESNASREFTDDLEQVSGTWQLIKEQFAAMEDGGGSPERLLELSEAHFAQADAMVLSAQHRAERDLLWTIVGCIALVVLVSTIVALRERTYHIEQQRAYDTDRLTGGYNETAFERLAGEAVRSAPPRSYLAVYTNVENFRVINESFGRPAGDDVIRALHDLLRQAARRGEIVAHLNADHFALLLRNSGARVELLAAQVAAQLKVRDDLPFSDRLVCGYGVFELTGEDGDVATGISNAAVVLKEGTGTDLIARYDDEFRSTLAFRQSVVRHMAEALERGEFAAYVQPQFSLKDGGFIGGEMLCRWDSPDLGFLTPDRFIPLFERNGFVVELDFHMLEQACRRLQPALSAQTGDAPHLAVNLSRITLMQNGFEERFARLVEQWSVSPPRLHLEVTESAFAVDEEAVIRILANLQAQGFPIAVDDFGTGYSSLSLLRRMPIDVLKIDRGFLSESEDDVRSRRVLESVIDLARDLGVKTVCEGIETREQAQLLHDLGCEIGQGYVFARPLPFEEFAARYSPDAAG
ncbi:putative bifunctional diguanylate cyclase/phosphodiesterase [Arabiibacter massiliensis]|uniref:putative bifunctional diguanylate cyclase/phosphodiesterase n=1 Tax=Arabiibacter massiliensis TaxID=1870985 RepID=UPI0009BA076F|nr:EAL domain-containing protein [Arabiibacter massiliensis]